MINPVRSKNWQNSAGLLHANRTSNGINKTLVITGSLLIFYGLGISVLAQSLQSTSYRLDESYIGPGGTINSSSPNYRESSTAGDLGVGQSLSASYRAQAGFNTTNDPRLVMIVNTSSINFGAFSTAAATTATATFSVLNYTSSGYGVFTVGNPPAISGHTLSGMSSTGPSQNGVEQFGINLVANSSPVSFGNDPAQIPSGIFSFGAASSGYNGANNFRYVAGEQIAESVKTSGETDYTVSYIVNAATNTPAGKYQGTQALVVVGTY